MSENYIVSARKYRPQTFETVVGQEHITTTLKNAIKNQHLAHAYLFCGPRGVGKTSCARILAKTINCESPTADMEACGVCNTCISFNNNTSFNVFELDAASNNSVDDIRELTNQVRFAPQQGRYKVYIIDEVHMLSAAAFNAFLKTLEEPPPYAIFILATTEKHKILPTILSRCQIFDFKRITTNDIVAHLHSIATKEGMVAQEAALHIIAQKSEGAMRDALSMLDRIASFTNGMLTYSNTMEHLNMLDADFYFRLTDNMLAKDVAGTLLQLDGALERGFEGDVIINGMAEHFRNLLLCRDARMAKLLDVPNDFRPIYHEKANQAPPSFILSALNVINDSELNYKTATNKRLHVEMCLIRLCYLLDSLNGSQQGDSSLSDSKKNSDSVAPAPAPQLNNTANNAFNSVVNEPVGQVYNSKTEPTPAPPVTPAPAPQAATPAAPQAAAYVQPSPAQQQVAPLPSAAAVQPQSPPPQPAAPRYTQPTGGNRKLSMNMLSDLDDAVVKAASEESSGPKTVTQEMALELFDQFKKKLQAEAKSILFAQFDMMRVNMLPDNEMRLISPSELTNTYAREMRNELVEYYTKACGTLVRVTMEVQEDQSVIDSQTTKVLSRSEIYDVMASKNPSLGRLKDALGMQLEY